MLLALLLACAEPDPKQIVTDSALDTAPEDSAPTDTETSDACSELATRSCACDDAASEGSQRCLADSSAWGSCSCQTYGAALHVDPDAAAGGDGSAAAPFLRLEDALTVVEAAVAAGLPEGGLVVWLGGGTYALTSSFALTAASSGSAGKPVVWRGVPGEVAKLVGGVNVDPAQFMALTEATPGYARVDVAARSSVRVADLGALGVADPGALVRRGFCANSANSAAELYVDGSPLRLARWPDADENTATIVDPMAATLTVYGSTTPDVSGSYTKVGENDGVGVYARDALVDGLQYRLYRNYWEYNGSWYRAWFLTTNTSGYPGSTNPWFYLYSDDLGSMSASNGASGTPSFSDLASANHGFASIVAAVDDRSFVYAGDRPNRWATAPDAWLHGMWKYSWADCHVPLAAIDTAATTLTLGDSPGYGIAAGQAFYAYNLLEELTQPGEWYLDRATNLLYVWPPEGFDTAQVQVSVLSDPVLVVSKAHDIQVQDLTIEAARGDLLKVDESVDVQIEGLRLRNGGRYGAMVTGTNVALDGLLVYGTGAGGVSISGGERRSLTRGNVSISNSAIHDFARWEWTYRPGVYATGVGQTVANNAIWSAPHSAILFSGNDHSFTRNDIHDVLQYSSDAGAIYSGRDWGARGNVIAQNFIHDLSTVLPGYGVHGIYLDDCLSGVDVTGNLLYGITGNAIQHGGGRDDHITGNLVARSGVGLATDARCATWANTPSTAAGSSWNLLEKLEAQGYQQEPWASRWPECAAIPDDYDVIFEAGTLWRYPEGTTFSSNVAWEAETWIDDGDNATTYFADTSNNQTLDASPFVDEAAGDLRLDPVGAAFSVPGFEDIPLDLIGVQE
jgi:hypothetical protein